MSSARRLHISRQPRLDEVMYIAQGKAMVLALKIVILVLEDVGELDSEEVANLLQAEPPMHKDIMAQTYAQLIMSDLVSQLRGRDPGGLED